MHGHMVINILIHGNVYGSAAFRSAEIG